MKLAILSSALLVGGVLALPGRLVDRASGVKYAGVNIAGFDFGCQTDGSQNISNAYPPVKALGGPDGAAQMQHFAKSDNMNLFRLPVGWQYLLNNKLGGTLDADNFAKYDQLVQACLATGAACVIDVHNYARWNGQIIGQGSGPTNDDFVNLWTQLATKYKSVDNIMFGLMNEPHQVDITKWATTVQLAVAAIRGAGATTQTILLPGNDYTSASAFISNGSGPALLNVTNPDGSTTNLVFDVHKYLDSDNSGTHAECTTDNVAAFTTLATWLRTNKRMALNSETGGGNVASCQKMLCAQIAYINANSDVYLGYLGWSAGSFDSTYVLTETPTGAGTSFQDTSLTKSCLAR